MGDVMTSSRADSAVANLLDKLGGCASSLNHWSQSLNKNIWGEIKRCIQVLFVLRNKADGRFIAKFDEMLKELVDLLVRKEDYWRQRANASWSQDGNLNTRYFHSHASACKKAKKNC